MSKKIILVLAGVLCSLSLNAQSTQQTADTLELKQVIVTASKIPTSLRATTKPVLVIDEQTISNNPGKDLAQLLSEQSGIYVNGAYSNGGKDRATYLQGASTRYTLFLIDGLPVYDPSTIGGVFDIRNLSLESVERIEVVKGSMSTLYGSDAIAGVVNIITKEAGGNDISLNAQSSIGSFGTYKNQVGVNGSNEGGSFSIVYSRDESDGISEARDSLTSAQRQAQNLAAFDNDGYVKNTVSVKTSVEPMEGLTISPRLLINSFEGDYDDGAFNDAPNKYDSDFFNPAITIQYRLGKFSFRNDYSYANTNRKNVASFGGEYEGKLFNYDAFGTYSPSDLLRVLAGFNYQNMEIGSFERTSDLYSPYLTLRLMDAAGFNGEAGLRFNKHSEFGDHLTVSGSLSYQLSQSIKVLSSVGTGFKTPTLDELYGPFGANADLQPEESLYFNFGTEVNLPENNLAFTANFFVRSIDDIIIYGTQGYVNQDEQNNKGLELFASYSPLPELKLQASFDYLTGTSVVNGQETDNLLRRPNTKLVLGGSIIPVQGLSISVQGSYLGERDDVFYKPDFSSEIITLEEVFLLNLNASYSLLYDQVSIFADINNLLDADYQEIYGYNTMGINYRAGIRLGLSR